jgi:hypothetical protein
MTAELRRMDDERIAILETRVDQILVNQEEYKKEANDWRGRFCKKLDFLISKMSSFPCESRLAESKAMNKEIGWLQKIVFTVSLLCISGLIAWGAISNQVEVNTQRWNRYLEQHPNTK